MSIQKDFEAFLSDIEPSKTTKDQVASAHHAIRDYLAGHEYYTQHCAKTYLSGSYAKDTCIRPAKDDDNRDVDVVVETDYGTEESSADVIIEVRDVLEESPRYSSAHLQTHSVGVSLSKIDIDVVPLAAEGDMHYIGCLDDGSWSETDPKGHINWTTEVNSEHNGKYKPVVKIMKWWRRENCPNGTKWPKGITLEKIVADCFPDDVTLYEDIVTELMENVLDALSEEVEAGTRPTIVDPVLPTNDLARGYTLSDFKSFLKGIETALDTLDEDGSRNTAWRKVLGNRFPADTSSRNSAALTRAMPVVEALRVPYRQKSPWPFTKKKPGIQVIADVTFPDGHKGRISSNDKVIPKGCEIDYRIIRSKGISTYTAKWLVVNTGEEALNAGCPRGTFEDSNIDMGGRHETTAYEGRHYVQCLLLKNNRCVAHSREFFIIVE